MKIVAPLSHVEYYEPLVSAGADEFFCGIIPYEWLKAYNNSLPINRREYLYLANISTYSSLEILRRMIEKHQIPVKITFNSHYYIREQYPLLMDIIKRLQSIGFDTFIMADPALILYLRQEGLGCKIHLSGETAEVNSAFFNFFNPLRISRYIFHRKNTLEDMKGCIKGNDVKGLEFEAFILNELCPFTGAFCNSIHSEEIFNACRVHYKLVSRHPDSIRFKMVARTIKLKEKIGIRINYGGANSLGSSGCGLCRIYDLNTIGMTHLKVVGRGRALEPLVRDIRCIKEIIRIADEETDNNHFIKTVKEKYLNNQCPDLCYYI